jgi:hypothetical protein
MALRPQTCADHRPGVWRGKKNGLPQQPVMLGRFDQLRGAPAVAVATCVAAAACAIGIAPECSVSASVSMARNKLQVTSVASANETRRGTRRLVMLGSCAVNDEIR